MTTDRHTTLQHLALEHLSHTPIGYLMPEAGLLAHLKLSIVPAPDAAEFESVLRRLEADRLAHCEISPLGVKKWSITTAGRAALADA